MVAKMILTTYNANGISIETDKLTETGDTVTGGPVHRRAIMIRAGRKPIMEVAEVSSNTSGTARLLAREVILGDGEWLVDQPVEVPKSPTMTATPPPPYSDFTTDTTITGVAKNAEITITVRDTAFGRGATLEPCKRISIVSGLTPTCQISLLLFMAKDMTPTQPADGLELGCHGLHPDCPRMVTVVGPWSVFQRRRIPPPLTIPRLYTTPSIFGRMSAMIKTLVEVGTSEKPAQHLPGAQTPK
jgi:hypothetical protein